MSIKKSKKRKDKFPNIYRFISDRKKVFGVYSKTLIIFTLFIFIVTIIVLGYDLYENIQDKEKIDLERDRITKEINFWNSFLGKHKGYRDGYLQLSILEYKLRNFNKAKSYLDEALAIDPNFEKGKELEKVLSIKH